jgi:hypothetical protein
MTGESLSHFYPVPSDRRPALVSISFLDWTAFIKGAIMSQIRGILDAVPAAYAVADSNAMRRADHSPR